MKNLNCNEMTYEQIGRKLKISTQQVHITEKRAMNKVIRNIIVKKNLDIFDAIIYYCELFGLEIEQCYKKLDAENRITLDEYLEKSDLL